VIQDKHLAKKVDLSYRLGKGAFSDKNDGKPDFFIRTELRQTMAKTDPASAVSDHRLYLIILPSKKSSPEPEFPAAFPVSTA